MIYRVNGRGFPRIMMAGAALARQARQRRKPGQLHASAATTSGSGDEKTSNSMAIEKARSCLTPEADSPLYGAGGGNAVAVARIAHLIPGRSDRRSKHRLRWLVGRWVHRGLTRFTSGQDATRHPSLHPAAPQSSCRYV